VTPNHDVVLVGGGGAGLRAAIAIAETNPHLDIAVVSRCIRCGAIRCRRKEAPPARLRPNDSLDEHAFDTVAGRATGCAIRTRSRRFVREARRSSFASNTGGCPWSRESRWPRRRAPVRRHEEDAHVVCRG